MIAGPGGRPLLSLPQIRIAQKTEVAISIPLIREWQVEGACQLT